MGKNLILFTDSGDTLIDESTQVYDEKGIVTRAEFIPGAGEVLAALCEEGFRIALVADGEWDSFQNVYRENGMGHCFEQWIVSEVVGEQKPGRSMFDAAMQKMGLTDADKPRIVMIGNNLKKDIAGANRYGITSIWLDWSPRYFHTAEEPDWRPDYIVKTPKELKCLLDSLERRLEVAEKLRRMTDAFTGILYEADEGFLKNMEGNNLAGDDISKYRYWEWTQGVGLFGLWKLFCHARSHEDQSAGFYEKAKEEKVEAGEAKEEKARAGRVEEGKVQGGQKAKTEYSAERLLEILRKYYDRQLSIGFPALNVNTAAPYLTMSFLAEYTGEEKYMEPCRKAAGEIMESFPRTEEGGFQHKTSDSLNEGELWDDTLYMTVLFLANMGRILGDEDMVREAQYQFLLHGKYLCDRETGLWYHGWTFCGRHNFAKAFWGRGNCWITMAIPEFLSILPEEGPVRRILTECLRNQAESLRKYQSESGMWHTLVDDPDSYPEASATCGFAYGILKAVQDGLLDPACREMAEKALPAILECISEDGVVNQVSYGTPMGRTEKEFYKKIPLKPMPYGQALAMLFFIAWQD